MLLLSHSRGIAHRLPRGFNTQLLALLLTKASSAIHLRGFLQRSMLTSVTRVTRLKAMLGAEIVKPVSTSIKM